VQAKMIYVFNEHRYFLRYEIVAQHLAVIVLADKISFSNGVTPVCIDWYSKYKVRNGTYGKVNLLYNILSL